MEKKKLYQYGYNPDELDKRIQTPERQEAEWGYFKKIIDDKNYGLLQFFIKKGLVFSLKPKDYFQREAVIYLENGSAIVKLKEKENKEQTNSLKAQETLLFPTNPPFESMDITGKEDSFIYIFSGPSLNDDFKNCLFKKSETFDRRNKSWSENQIETIANRKYAGKKIFLKKGNSTSLEFHCKKTETYFIHSGKVLLRFRAGQGEDRFFIINPGQVVNIPPGLMHQKGALEDTIIIEVSTPDEDRDSFIVESEFAEMPKLKENLAQFINTKGH